MNNVKFAKVNGRMTPVKKNSSAEKKTKESNSSDRKKSGLKKVAKKKFKSDGY